MSIGTNGKALAALTKNLLLTWQQTRESWQDAKSEEFERKYLGELATCVDKAGAVFDQLDKLVNKVRHDCE